MYEDMDPAIRREYSDQGRRKPTHDEPIITIQGNGLDRPYVPDSTVDHPLSSRPAATD